MDILKIHGGVPVCGSMSMQGAKNSVLPILAATILIEGISVIHNCPHLKDVEVAIEILRHLGCSVTFEDKRITVDASVITRYDIPDELMAQMRSSVMFLGPILARCRHAQMTFPGGCELGSRPIDLHLSAIEEMGAKISKDTKCISCEGQDLCGEDIHLSLPSVGATENIMMAACCAKGPTRIINAACEPEIRDLQGFLNSAGFLVSGASSSVIEIEPGKSKKNVEYTVMSDRIAAQTYLIAAAITKGKLEIKNINPMDIFTGVKLLDRAGCDVKINNQDIYINAQNSIIRNVSTIKTMPHPGFPTDAQSIFMSLMAVAKGTTVFVENIFTSRYRHVSEMIKMGADAKIIGKTCVVTGVESLYGASVRATDLRGGAALILCGLCARGTTEIRDIYHIDRGYDDVENTFKALGADILREKGQG